MSEDERDDNKIIKYFLIVGILTFSAYFYWPRFDLAAVVWVFVLCLFINDRLDEQLVERLHVPEQSNQETDDYYYFYYKDVLATAHRHRSSVPAFVLLYFFMTGLPKKSEPWDLINIGIVVVFLGGMLFRYFYLKYDDSVEDKTLPKPAPKKSRHFIYLDDTVLREIKGCKQWQVQLDQITAIDLSELEVWFFYREQGQIKQHAIPLVEWERLSELRQKLRTLEQRLRREV